MKFVNNILISHTDLDGYGSQLMSLLRVSKSNSLDIIEKMYNKYKEGNFDIYWINDGECAMFYNFDYSEVDSGIRDIFSKANPLVTHNVYITDLNLSVDICDYLDDLKKQGIINHLELIDHHITGQDSTTKYPEWYNLTVGKSATQLAFDKLPQMDNMDTIKDLVSVINAADVFDTSDDKVFESGRCLTNILEPIFKSINNRSYSRFLIWTYLLLLIHVKDWYKYNGDLVDHILDVEDDYGRKRIKMLFNLLNCMFDNIPYGIGLLDPNVTIETPLHVLYYKNQIQTVLNLGTTASVHDTEQNIQYLVVSGFTQSISDVSYYTLLNRPDLDFIVFLLPNNVVSFRSFIQVGEDRSEHVRYDVSKLAAKFGGGGHMAAAGCTLKEEVTKDYIIEKIAEYI